MGIAVPRFPAHLGGGGGVGLRGWALEKAQSFIVLTVDVPGEGPVDARIAVGPDGTCACKGQHGPRAGCDLFARYAVGRTGPGKPTGGCGGAGSRRRWLTRPLDV